MAWQFIMAAALGCLAYLDRTAAFQLMLHRPLVVASVMGALFGNFAAGAQVGAVLELLYLARLPVGASIPPDDTGAAMFGGAAAAVASSSLGLDAGSYTAILLLSVPCAELGKSADRFVRRINGRIATLTVESVERGDSQAVEHGLLAGLSLFALSGMALALLFTGAGVAVAKFLLPLFGPASKLRFAAMMPVLPLIGSASVFSCSRTERAAPAFYLTMGTVFGATLFFRWVG
ncbi:MAG: PTS sugar transporter subunit IIC [Deltaproteobacteria bacterium]|nr:PTS sugar transporter subunit IIC [Deltaproteobacteria bacterium]